MEHCRTAFAFENYMQTILKMIRKNEKPLEQIVCHISEQNSCAKSTDKLKTIRKPQLQNLHFNGPIVNDINFNLKLNQYNKIIFKQFILKTTAPEHLLFSKRNYYNCSKFYFK